MNNQLKSSLMIIKFLCVCSFVFSQDTITLFYNKEWKELDQKEDAIFYRKMVKNSDNLWSVSDYYISDKIQMSGSYKSKNLNSKHGKFVYYHENGNLAEEGNYLNDREEGQWTFYHENGKKRSEGFFESKARVGVWIQWYTNGQKESEGYYMADKFSGKWIFWHDNGKIKSIGNFEKGVKDSVWVFYSNYGKVLSKEFYAENDLIETETYFQDGQLKSKGKYRNKKRDGDWNYYGVNGKLILRGEYHKGLRNGDWMRYFINGETMKMIYENGKLESKDLGGLITEDDM